MGTLNDRCYFPSVTVRDLFLHLNNPGSGVKKKRKFDFIVAKSYQSDSYF